MIDSERFKLAGSPFAHLRWEMLPGSKLNADEIERSLHWQNAVFDRLEESPSFEIRLIPDDSNRMRTLLQLASIASQSYRNFILSIFMDLEARGRPCKESASFLGLSRSPSVVSLEDFVRAIGLFNRLRWFDSAESLIYQESDSDIVLAVGPKSVLNPSSLFVTFKEFQTRHEAIFYAHESWIDWETGAGFAFRRYSEPNLYGVLSGPTVGDSLIFRREAWNCICSKAVPTLSLLTAAKVGAWRTELLASINGFRFGRIPLGLFALWTERTRLKMEIPRIEAPSSFRDLVIDYAGVSGLRLSDWKWDASLGAGIPIPVPASGKVAVIVPFRDQESLTAATICSLGKQTIVNDIIFYGVDNGSHEGLSKRLESLARMTFPTGQVHWIRDDSEFNFARLNNLAVTRGDEPYILFANNDIEVNDPRAIERHRAFLTWAGVGMISGILMYPDGRLQAAGIKFGAMGPEVVSSHDDEPNRFAARDSVTLAYALARRDAVEAVGCLDEMLCPNGFGDALLGHRMKELGWWILVDPQVKVVHHESVSRSRRSEELERYELSRSGLRIPIHDPDFAFDLQPGISRFGRGKPTLIRRLHRAFKAFRRELFLKT